MRTITQSEPAAHAVGIPVQRMVSGPAPERVQLSRAAGWRMPPNTVKVDRSTRWGNPYKMHGDGYPMTAEIAVGCFTSLLNAEDGGWVTRDTLTTVHDVRRELRGKNLACWCKLDQPCHADVLLRVANHEPANMICNGVFSTAIRNMGAGNSRATDRAAIIEAMKVYGLTGTDAHHVGAWCMAQMGYGGGL